MNLVYGEVVDLAFEGEMSIGRVRVCGAMKKIPLDLLTGIELGDRVLICDGIAIAKIEPVEDPPAATENRNVLGDSR